MRYCPVQSIQKRLIPLLLLLLPLPLNAQDSSLRVTTRDEADKPVGGVRLELKRAGNLEAAAMSNEKGEAEFPQTAPGTYQLSAAKDGFESLTQSDIVIAGGAPFEIKFIMVPRIVIGEKIDITASTAATTSLEQGANVSTDLQRQQVKDSAVRPTNVAETLPLVPGIIRTDQGQLKISGSSENRSALLVNSADVTDPATGQFGLTVPVDIVNTISVFKTPYLAQFGRFTAGVVSVDTRRGGDKWNFELNDPFPEMRYIGGNMRGLREFSPRITFNGPLIKNKLYFSQGAEYRIAKRRVLALTFPNNETVTESVNSFTQFDYLASPTHSIGATLHIAPRQAKFYNLDFFNERPVTPNYRARDYTGTIIDRLTIGENLLESTVAIKRARIGVWPQAEEEMGITPTGNFGNYFSSQDRHSSRYELLEILSLKPIKSSGTHDLKFGAGVTRTHLDGLFQGRPVNVFDSQNQLFRRIEFDGGSDYSRNDLELATFGQDHWLVTPKLAFDLGLRAERQNVTGTVRLAPRAGFAWTPFDSQNTVLRGGFGLFYDRVPLNVYSLDNYPEQIITTYGPGEIPIDGPRRYLNTIEQVNGRNTPFVFADDKAGNFAPYSATWTTEVEHAITKNLRLRFNYMSSNSFGLVIVTPTTIDGRDALVANGDGQSRYRQFEVMTKLAMPDGQSMFFSYVRSRARSNINEFNNYLGNFPYPIVRADQFTNSSADLPHRFLAWGTIKLPWKVRVSPLIEWRSGLPYSVFDEGQNYVGQPFSDNTRFPNFFSLDARFIRELEINRVVESLFKYKLKDKTSVRVSVSIYNLTNHFNPTSIHNNIADPQFGLFFGQNKRRFRLDLDLVF
ncbi:MAG: TonB-dependent receptor [Acidobacteria bacterium]|nr:TonB-dependent receptor [Acidobacteriota bacterium]